MAALFMASEGRVHRVVLDGATPVSVELFGAGGVGTLTDSGRVFDRIGAGGFGEAEQSGPSSGTAIVTGITLQHGTNHQFSRSLGRDVYLYTFGDQIGNVTLNGLCFANACEGDDANEVGGGFWHAALFYYRNRVSNRVLAETNVAEVGPNPTRATAAAAVRVLVAGRAISGFLTGVRVNLSDPSSYITDFSLSISVLEDPQL